MSTYFYIAINKNTFCPDGDILVDKYQQSVLVPCNCRRHFLHKASKNLKRCRKKGGCIWFKLASFFCVQIKVSFIAVSFLLIPHGSVFSQGLLFRPDKHYFYSFFFSFFVVYGNYCLKIVSNVTRLSMKRQADGRGDARAHSAVASGNICHQYAFCLQKRYGTQQYIYKCS